MLSKFELDGFVTFTFPGEILALIGFPCGKEALELPVVNLFVGLTIAFERVLTFKLI